MFGVNSFDFENNTYLPVLQNHKLDFCSFRHMDQPQESYLNQFLNENQSSLDLSDCLTLQQFCSKLEKHYQKRLENLSQLETLASKIYQNIVLGNQLAPLKLRIQLFANQRLDEIQKRKKQLETSPLGALLDQKSILEAAKSCEHLIRHIKPNPEAYVGYEYPCSVRIENTTYSLFQDNAEKKLCLIDNSLLQNKVPSQVALRTLARTLNICIPNDSKVSTKRLEEKDLRIARICIRYRQLLSIPEKFVGMSANHLMQTAQTIENYLCLPMPPQHLGSNQAVNRPYSLHFEEEAKRIFVNCKSKIHRVKLGGSKKVTIAFLVPYSLCDKAVTVAQKVFNKNAANEAEIGLQALLQQPSPMVQGHYFYNKRLSAGVVKTTSIPKISLYESYFENDLVSISSISLAWDEKISALIQLTQELLYIHQQSHLHGDIKPLNMLSKRDTSLGTIECRITDFGLSFHLKDGTPNFVLKRGYYGSVWTTAPEVLGSK